MIPETIQTQVLIECRRRCCLCYGLNNDLSQKSGQISHIDKNPKNRNRENLVFLCLDHHDKYDSSTSQSKNFTRGEIENYRSLLIKELSKCSFNEEKVEISTNEIPHVDIKNRTEVSLHFPYELKAALIRFLPDYRLPEMKDLDNDWKTDLDPKSSFPIFCKGHFSTSREIEYCFFSLNKNGIGFKILVLTEDKKRYPILLELRSGFESPTNLYVASISPGYYSISPLIWRNGGPKTIEIENDGIVVGMFESSAAIYYWDKEQGKFLEQWISD